MAETQKPMSSKDAGNATGSSSRVRQDLGVSDAPVASPKINQDDFFNDLDSLVGKGRVQGGCSIGYMMDSLDEKTRIKIEEIMKNDAVQSTRLANLLKGYGFDISSTDVLRRHRRRLQGRDGCMCYRGTK
jgi:hypothetical protein